MVTELMSIKQSQKWLKFSKVDHSEPWKEDGNIVICVEETYFRVHRSVLSDNSEVFRDMFDNPHCDEAEEEFVEHCPIVKLYDNATDIQIVLKALYDRSYPLPHHEDERISFPFIAAFLRLGEKYNIPVLVKEAKAKLHCFADPTSISAFLKLKEEKPLAQPRLFPGIIDADLHNFQIMNLLQEVGLKVPLPLAMYHCMVYCPSSIVGGYKSNGAEYTLSLANLRAYICMRQLFESLRIQLALKTYRSNSCTQTTCRVTIRGEWAEKAINAPPFCPWNSEWKGQLCKACSKSLEDRRAKTIGEAWGKLPTAFGFKSWEDVKNRGDLMLCTNVPTSARSSG